jgi:hypothetical protein
MATYSDTSSSESVDLAEGRIHVERMGRGYRLPFARLARYRLRCGKLDPFGFGRSPVAGQNSADGVKVFAAPHRPPSAGGAHA